MTWKDIKIEKPPKDRPFLGKKSNGVINQYAVFNYLLNLKEYYTSSACFDFEEIEKWCEIPPD